MPITDFLNESLFYKLFEEAYRIEAKSFEIDRYQFNNLKKIKIQSNFFRKKNISFKIL